jgi:hypothetical protein
MADIIHLKAEQRTEFGKGAARRIRRDGKVPAVMYSHDHEPIHVTLEGHATLLALRDGICPPTINLDTPDPECDLDYTPNEAVKAELSIGISDSFGFGGHDACIAFRRFED